MNSTTSIIKKERSKGKPGESEKTPGTTLCTSKKSLVKRPVFVPMEEEENEDEDVEEVMSASADRRRKRLFNKIS